MAYTDQDFINWNPLTGNIDTPKATTAPKVSTTPTASLPITPNISLSNSSPQPVSTVPQYNFTQTPAQNASAGNYLGYSGGGGGGSVYTPPVSTYTPPVSTAPPTPPVQQNSINQYELFNSPYTQLILDGLRRLQNKGPFSYNPDSDAALKTAQDQAKKLVMQDAAKKGRVFDTYTDVKMQEAAQDLIPAYQAAARQEYESDRRDMYDQLQALQTMDNTLYNRDYQRQTFNQNANIQQFNQNIQQAPFTGMYNGQPTTTELDRRAKNANTIEDRKIESEDRQRKLEIEQYGVALSPIARQYKTVFDSMPQQLRQQVLPYQNDYAAEINRRTSINPNDPIIPYLYAARSMKIISSPALMQQYGKDIGIASPAVEKLAMQAMAANLEVQTKQLQNAIERIKATYAGPKEQAELDKLKAELEAKEYDAAIKRLEATALPEKIKLELMGQIADIEYKNAAAYNQSTSASENIARVGLIGEQKNTEKAQQAKYYADATKTGKETINDSLFAQALGQMQNAPDQAKWLKDNAALLQKAGANSEFFGKLRPFVEGDDAALKLLESIINK